MGLQAVHLCLQSKKSQSTCHKENTGNALESPTELGGKRTCVAQINANGEESFVDGCGGILVVVSVEHYWTFSARLS